MAQDWGWEVGKVGRAGTLLHVFLGYTVPYSCDE